MSAHETRTRIAWAIVGGVLMIAFAIAYAVGIAHAEEPSVVVTGSRDGFSTTGGDFTWPATAGLAFMQLLRMVERVSERAAAFADRWLDKTGGRIKVDHKKTIISYSTGGDAGPEDITGPVPELIAKLEDRNRRKGRT